MLGTQEIAEEVDIHHRPPFLGGELGDLLGDEDTRVGHQDVKPAKFLDSLVHHSRHLFLVGYVHLDGDGTPVGFRLITQIFGDSGRRLDRGLLVQVGHHHVAAFARQPPANSLPQPLTAAGDKRHLILQPLLHINHLLWQHQTQELFLGLHRPFPPVLQLGVDSG